MASTLGEINPFRYVATITISRRDCTILMQDIMIHRLVGSLMRIIMFLLAKVFLVIICLLIVVIMRVIALIRW